MKDEILSIFESSAQEKTQHSIVGRLLTMKEIEEISAGECTYGQSKPGSEYNQTCS